MSSDRILIVDDEPQIRRIVSVALAGCGYAVTEAASGEEALEKARGDMPDLVLLDMNLPGIDGLETCRALRQNSDVRIIILSVRGAERDKVHMLDLGADDYVTKPFSMEELLARIRAAMRRRSVPQNALPQVLALDGLSIDFEGRCIRAGEQEVHLTPKEFELLRYLVMNEGQVVPHRRLLQAVWGPDYGDEVEYLRVFINQLRRKIEADPASPRYILTEPWVGYKFVAPAKAGAEGGLES